jgi:hypothetical protein
MPDSCQIDCIRVGGCVQLCHAILSVVFPSQTAYPLVGSRNATSVVDWFKFSIATSSRPTQSDSANGRIQVIFGAARQGRATHLRR